MTSPSFLGTRASVLIIMFTVHAFQLFGAFWISGYPRGVIPLFFLSLSLFLQESNADLPSEYWQIQKLIKYLRVSYCGETAPPSPPPTLCLMDIIAQIHVSYNILPFV